LDVFTEIMLVHQEKSERIIVKVLFTL